MKKHTDNFDKELKGLAKRAKSFIVKSLKANNNEIVFLIDSDDTDYCNELFNMPDFIGFDEHGNRSYVTKVSLQGKELIITADDADLSGEQEYDSSDISQEAIIQIAEFIKDNFGN